MRQTWRKADVTVEVETGILGQTSEAGRIKKQILP
jgi:hypothetical protein